MIPQFLRYSLVIEKIVFSLRLAYTGCCFLEILRVLIYFVSMIDHLWICDLKLLGCCCFRLCIGLCQEMIFWGWNLKVKFQSFFVFYLVLLWMLLTQLFLPFYIINISSIYQRYIRCGRDISWNWNNFHKLFFRIFSITTRSSRPEESPLAESYSSKVRDVSPVTLL